MVIRRPEWRRLMGLLTPPAQSSQQPLSQVPANRSPCLWSQSGLSGDRAPFPRLRGVRGAKNFTLFFFFFCLFKESYKPLVFLLLLWVCFSAFLVLSPQVVLKANRLLYLRDCLSFFLAIAGQIHIALSPVSIESFQGLPHLLPWQMMPRLGFPLGIL